MALSYPNHRATHAHDNSAAGQERLIVLTGASERSCCPPASIDADRKLDRNAENQQRTTPNVDEREPALEATGRTPANVCERHCAYPPFGILRHPVRLNQPEIGRAHV